MTVKWQLSANVDLLAGQVTTGWARIEAVGELGGVTVVIPAIRDTVDNIIFTGPQRVKLNGGELLDAVGDPIMLPDSTGTEPGFSPADWSYRVTLILDHLQPAQYPVYVFQLGADLDLADVVSVPPESDPLDTPWVDSADAAAASAAAAEAFRDELEAMLDDTAPRREGNLMDATSRDFHPPNRPRIQRFDGTSHPLSEYYATLAAAQVKYPHATALTDETDWAALQLAINTTVAYPRQWGLQAIDWRQYGTAKIELPVGGFALINRPLIKAADTNKNYMICSPSVWGARIKYTGVDGGRAFVFEKDGVGTVLDLSNLVLEGGGILLRGPFRGDVRVGNGCLIIDTPHPAIQTEDTDVGLNQVGVVGINVANLYTHGCAGGFWPLSSTATITTLRDSRFIANMDIPLKIDTIDFLGENIDCTGVAIAKAQAGTGPYIQITAAISAVTNVDLRDVRMGSEVGSVGGPYEWAPPREYILIGEPGAPANTALGNVRLRKVGFRTNNPTAVMARAAILVNAPVALDVDDCDFEAFTDCLVDDAANATLSTVTGESRWGPRNTSALLNHAPNFKNGGTSWYTTTRAAPVDPRAVFNPSTGQNLLDPDLSTWSLAAATLGAATAGGPNGGHYYPLTKTGTSARVFKNPVTLTPGKRYAFGVTARRQAGSVSRDFKLRVQFTGASTIIPVDSKVIRLDDDWVTYFVRIPYVPAGVTGANFGIYADDQEVNPTTGGIDLYRPFLTEGWTPKIPQDNLILSPRKAAPSPAVAGMVYLANGSTWDPLTRGGSEPYMVFWTGTAWHAVSTVPTTVTPPFQANNATTTATTPNTSTEQTLSTLANIPAAQLHVGDRVKVHAIGNMDSKAAPGTYNIRTKVNGTTQLTTSAITSSATGAATGAAWELNLDLIITATGAAGGFRLVGTQTRASGNTHTRTTDNVLADVTGVDLSGGLQVLISGQTSTADVLNTIRHHASSVEKL